MAKLTDTQIYGNLNVLGEVNLNNCINIIDNDVTVNRILNMGDSSLSKSTPPIIKFSMLDNYAEIRLNDWQGGELQLLSGSMILGGPNKGELKEISINIRNAYIRYSNMYRLLGRERFEETSGNAYENMNFIEFKHNNDGSITTNNPNYNALSSIRHCINFRWYNDYWQIGNIRSSNDLSDGFGVTYNDSLLCFRVTKSAIHSNSILPLSGDTINVGKFKFTNGMLTNDGFNFDSSITLRNDANGSFLSIGGNVNSVSGGLTTIIARFENTRQTVLDTSKNIALQVQARGAKDNIAILLKGGSVGRFAEKVQVINTTDVDKTIKDETTCIVFVGNGTFSVTMPDTYNYDDGRVLDIKNVTNGSITIYPGKNIDTNTSQCFNIDRNTTTDRVVIGAGGDAFKLIFARYITGYVGGGRQEGCWIQFKHPRDW